MIVAIVQLVVGMVVLFVGGEYLVGGATRIALWARVSTTVVALTVVAMGTSLPELAVSLGAGFRDSIDIAYGNVLGSNIFNIGAILGIGALIGVIPVQGHTLRIEYPFMLAVSASVPVLARDGLVARSEGVLLLLILALFTAFVIRQSMRDEASSVTGHLQQDVEQIAGSDVLAKPNWARATIAVLLGMVALAIGADQAVRGAVEIATVWGIQERVIGLTVVALGTSLPELATTVVALRQGRPEIALGNVIGSNIFNVLGILGATAAVITVPVNPEANRVDVWIMVAFSAAIFPMLFWGRAVRRRDGVVLLVGFTAYMLYLMTHAAVA